MKPNAFFNHVPTYDWVKQLESITKWPFQYYWFMDDEQTITDNLVVAFNFSSVTTKQENLISTPC